MDFFERYSSGFSDMKSMVNPCYGLREMGELEIPLLRRCSFIEDCLKSWQIEVGLAPYCYQYCVDGRAL